MTEIPNIMSNTIGTANMVYTGDSTAGDPFFSGVRQTFPQRDAELQHLIQKSQIKTDKEDEDMADSTRRFIKVFIVDPEESVPLENCLLYSGKEQMTELTDEELFFEIPIKDLLDEHNKTRVKLKKEGGEKGEKLKPARIRDLTMTVVTIAQF